MGYTIDSLKPHLSAGGPLGEDNEGNTVMTGLVPVIHVVELPETLESAINGAAWMAGTSPIGAKLSGQPPS